MKRLALALLIASGFAASAQPTPDAAPRENVIVTAPRLSDELKATIHNFVSTYAIPTPAPVINEIPRWRKPICVQTDGLTATANLFITERVKQVAAMVGAPVAGPGCRKNMEIAFTAQPQAVLDYLRAHDPRILGYYTGHNAAEVETVRFPVQAWYATATRDYDGQLVIDTNFAGFTRPPCPIPTPSCEMMEDLPDKQVEGSLLRTGLSSEFAVVNIIVNAPVTGDIPMGALADHIALLALSETNQFDVCQPLASIANLMAPDCDASRKPGAITDTDLALLRGIYSMDPAASLLTQRTAISSSIEAALGGGR